MKAIVHLQNYKKIKHLLAEFASGNIYFVKASNNSGKTSFLQAFLSTLQGKNTNKKALSFGTVEGSVTTRILDFQGKDNENYTIKFDMAEGKDDKFVIIRPDTTIGKKVTDITSIFQYNSFTVDDWFAWGATADGRRKQAKILLAMLPAEAQKEFEEIEAKINPRNGTMFEERRKANIVYDTLFTSFNQIIFTENELKMLEMGQQWQDDSQALIKKKDDALKLLANNGPLLQHIESLKNTLQRFKDDKARKEQDYADFVKNTKDRIEQYKQSIVTLEGQITSAEEETQSIIRGFDTSIEKAEITLKAEEEKLPKESPDVAKLEADIATRKPYDDILTTAIAKKKNQDEKRVELQAAFDKKEKLTADIEDLRTKKQNIIVEAKMPVDNIVIQSDEVLYVDPDTKEELPFSEENVSYSRGGLIVAQIMLAVNKQLPILMVGKAAEYDTQSLDQLAELAAANDAIIILDKVVQGKEELTIECYDNIATTGEVVNMDPDAVVPKKEADQGSVPFDLFK